MKAIDLFCGAGGMTLGFLQAGFDVVASIDAEKKNVETHHANLPGCRCWEADLAATTGRSILRRAKLRAGELAVVFGGPPCQGFSEIGHRRTDDRRNRLVMRFAELVCELRPAYFVMENVRGLLFSKHRSLVKRFLVKVQAAGYAVVDPIRILNAADYGVPQRRLRAFLLGHRVGTAAPKYPKPRRTWASVREAIADLPEVGNLPELLDTDLFTGALGEPSVYAAALRATDGLAKALSGCQQTRHRPEVVARFAATAAGACEPKSRCYRIDPDGVSFALRAGTGPSQGSFTAARPIHPWSPRVITVREAARLHSFPDWFQFQPTKWHAFRQIGNSVPPLLAQAVASSIAEALRESSGSSPAVRREPPRCPSHRTPMP